MPRLVLFAACEKAFVDQQTNVLSLMSLLQDINVQIPPGTIVASNAAIPMHWAVVSMFQPTPEDKGKTYEHRTTLIDNAGAMKLETPISPFELKTDPHRIIGQINGMPIGSEGAHEVNCLIREKGASDWKEIASYPIAVKWVAVVNPTIH